MPQIITQDPERKISVAETKKIRRNRREETIDDNLHINLTHPRPLSNPAEAYF